MSGAILIVELPPRSAATRTPRVRAVLSSSFAAPGLAALSVDLREVGDADTLRACIALACQTAQEHVAGAQDALPECSNEPAGSGRGSIGPFAGGFDKPEAHRRMVSVCSVETAADALAEAPGFSFGPHALALVFDRDRTRRAPQVFDTLAAGASALLAQHLKG